MENRLFYTTPAADWFDSLPIGNGRLAAMVTNKEQEDVLFLNHENLWYRYEKKLSDTVLNRYRLGEIRRLVSLGKYTEASYLGYPDYVGGEIYNHTDEHTPGSINTFKPAGNLHIRFSDAGEYLSRQLDLFEAVSSVFRENISGEFWVSATDPDLIAAHYDGAVNCRITLDRETEPECCSDVTYTEKGALFTCTTYHGKSFYIKTVLDTDGAVTADLNGITVENGHRLTLYTTVSVWEMPKASFGRTVDYGESKKAHTEKFGQLADRLALDLGESNGLPTDKRIQGIRSGGTDIGLVALYLHYGRYLLISSSLLGRLPANLQGKWNRDLRPPWNSDYHLDINLQMNYWLAESGNLSETTNAFFTLFDGFRRNYTDRALKNLGCHGLYIPCTLDNEGTFSIGFSGWGTFMGTASWIAQHYYKHFEYSGDMDFLRDRAYPFFREVARFWQDYLFYDKDGVAQICPSTSPENTFIPDCDIWSGIGQSCAHDVQLCYDALGYAIDSASLLGLDEQLIPVWKKLRNDLPGFPIGSDGRLMEWDKEFPEKEPGHRHFSHLYGVFPGELFTSETGKDQWKAALKSLDHRLSHEGGHTGWSRAWSACLYARFGESEKFYQHLNHLLTDFSTDSLLDLHPPKIFQIDGNLGGAEAILQSLIQSRDGKIFLLFALPDQWKQGEIKGVKAVGGHTLDYSWEDGKIKHLTLTVGFSAKGAVVLPDGKELPFEAPPDTRLQFDF